MRKIELINLLNEYIDDLNKGDDVDLFATCPRVWNAMIQHLSPKIQRTFFDNEHIPSLTVGMRGMNAFLAHFAEYMDNEYVKDLMEQTDKQLSEQLISASKELGMHKALHEEIQAKHDKIAILQNEEGELKKNISTLEQAIRSARSVDELEASCRALHEERRRVEHLHVQMEGQLAKSEKLSGLIRSDFDTIINRHTQVLQHIDAKIQEFRTKNGELTEEIDKKRLLYEEQLARLGDLKKKHEKILADMQPIIDELNVRTEADERIVSAFMTERDYRGSEAFDLGGLRVLENKIKDIKAGLDSIENKLKELSTAQPENVT